MNFPRVGLILALSIVRLCAQPAGEWAGLSHAQTISAGMDIKVTTVDNKQYRGQFHTAEDDALVMTTANGEQRVARSTVARMAVKRPGHRLRNTLIGLGIGAAGGLVIGAASDASCSPHCFLGGNIGKELLTPVGAVIGAIVGVVLPTGGWRDVYRVK